MLRPSPNHGTQRLPNDDDDDCVFGNGPTSVQNKRILCGGQHCPVIDQCT